MIPEVVEYQVRVLFRDILELDFLLVDVVPHNNVAQVEVGRGPERKVGDDQPIRSAPGLMNDDEVCHIVCSAGFNELRTRKPLQNVFNYLLKAPPERVVSYLFVLVVTPV